MLRKLLVLCFVTLAASSAQPAAENHFDGKSWWGHVKVLAADDMEGRETGSAGLRKAEAYVVEQLRQAGLRPAGTDGFYQPIKFVSRQIVEKDSSAFLLRNGKTQPLTLGEDAIFSTRVNLAPEIEAPLVFVGAYVVHRRRADMQGSKLRLHSVDGDVPHHQRSRRRQWWR